VTRVALFVKCHAKPGRGAEALTLLEEAFRGAANEPGTLCFAIHGASDDPDTFWVYELYDSLEAQTAHRTSDTTIRLTGLIADVLAEPLQVAKAAPLLTAGVPE
jgi:autoinducer 2-degrading protein